LSFSHVPGRSQRPGALTIFVLNMEGKNFSLYQGI
jgi:hypothetical protein